MVQFRHAQREIQFKVVYYGPAMGGKTSNLEALHELSDPEGRTQVVSMKTSDDRTLFFDFLPFDLGEVQGYHIRLQVFTVPGQVQYNTTRKVVLAGSDAVIFVADSQREQGENNFISWENMKANFLANKMDLKDIPVVIQCNKQDLPGVMGPEEVLEKIRVEGHPVTLASAVTGEGVVETFLLSTQRTLSTFVERYRLSQKGVTPEKIAEGVARVFEPFLGKRRASAVRAEHGHLAKAPLAAQVAVRGLTEEEQLIAALESSTQLAEQYQDAQLLSRKYEERLREMTTLYEVGTAMAQVTTVRDALSRLPEVLSRFRKGWAVSSFRGDGDTLEPVATQGMDHDPLWAADIPGTGNLATGLFQRGSRVHLKELSKRFDRVQAHLPAGLCEAVGLTLGEGGQTLGRLIVYCSSPLAFGPEDDRFFTLLEQVAIPRLLTLDLMEQLSKSNDTLERKVIERTADLHSALDRLKDVDRLKHAFLNNISHEVKTPLTNIRSYTDLLLRYPEQRITKAEEYLRIVVEESVHLEDLLDDLLSYSRIKNPARGDSTDLSDLVKSAIDSLEMSASAKQISLQLQGAEDPVSYPMNGEDAQILFRQILDNAVKFSPEGSKVKVYFLDDPMKAIFAVRDYGPGIPMDQRDRLLEPFEQGISEVPNFKAAGLGVGLFLVREVVRKYGGTLHIENMEPGTNVMVELPKPDRE
jgi:signal transduction histidine kinase/signal recognition particle receptor subunit beta